VEFFLKFNKRLLKRNGKRALILILIEVVLHARINIPVVRPVLFHLIGNVLESLPHAVLDHFLFGLFGFLELFNQNRDNL
jgi:hypothetical protein